MLRANTMFPNRSALNSGSFSSLLAFWSSATVGLSGSSLSGNRYRLRPFTSEPQSWVRLGKAHHSMVRQTVTCNDCNERWKGHYSTVIGVEQTHLPQPKKSMTCPTSCINISTRHSAKTQHLQAVAAMVQLSRHSLKSSRVTGFRTLDFSSCGVYNRLSDETYVRSSVEGIQNNQIEEVPINNRIGLMTHTSRSASLGETTTDVNRSRSLFDVLVYCATHELSQPDVRLLP